MVPTCSTAAAHTEEQQPCWIRKLLSAALLLVLLLFPSVLQAVRFWSADVQAVWLNDNVSLSHECNVPSVVGQQQQHAAQNRGVCKGRAVTPAVLQWRRAHEQTRGS